MIVIITYYIDIKKLQNIFEDPIQKFESKKLFIDKEMVNLKEELYNILETGFR